MGTHPSGPSKLLRSGQDLKEFIHQHPDVLGSAVRDHFGDDLPFLFKVLAIGKALSIQAHPDKTLAAQLHQDHPEIYKGALSVVCRNEHRTLMLNQMIIIRLLYCWSMPAAISED